jgi:hypothetical protein
MLRMNREGANACHLQHPPIHAHARSQPRVNGVSDHMSPREIMTGQRLDYARHCRFEYGVYVQTHEQHDSSMTPRSYHRCTCPLANRQCSGYMVLHEPIDRAGTEAEPRNTTPNAT